MSKAEALEECADTVSECLYQLWKHNRDADFSFLSPDILEQKREEFLKRLVEDQARATRPLPDASVPDSLEVSAPQDLPTSQQ